MYSRIILFLLPSLTLSASLAGRQSTARPFNQLTISNGAGGIYRSLNISNNQGNAASEALAIFPGTGVGLTETDLNTLNTEARCAVDAEALFDSTIAASSGTVADALNVGKIKNKVLKLTGFTVFGNSDCLGEVLVLNVKIALGQNSADNMAKLAEEAAKLAKDIQLDLGNVGKPSMTVPFVCG